MPISSREKEQLKSGVERLQKAIGNQENRLLNLKRLLQTGANQSFLGELDKLINENNRSIRDLTALNLSMLPNRLEVAAQIKKLGTLTEEVRNRRQGITASFENWDQKTNQLFNILSTVIKNEKEAAQSITRNLL